MKCLRLIDVIGYSMSRPANHAICSFILTRVDMHLGQSEDVYLDYIIIVYITCLTEKSHDLSNN